MTPLALAGLIGGLLGRRGPSESTTQQVESLDFDSLLERARSGEVSSGREVEFPEGFDLTEEQRGRVAQAVDRAEAAGALSAVVLIDGRALQVNVAERKLTGELEAGGDALTGADTVVVAAESSDDGSSTTTGLAAGDATALLNRLSGFRRAS